MGAGMVVSGYVILLPGFVPPCIAKDAVTEAEGTAPELAGCQEYTGWACGVGYSCLLSLV